MDDFRLKDVAKKLLSELGGSLPSGGFSSNSKDPSDDYFSNKVNLASARKEWIEDVEREMSKALIKAGLNNPKVLIRLEDQDFKKIEQSFLNQLGKYRKNSELIKRHK